MNQLRLRFDTAQIGHLREVRRRFSALKASIEEFAQFRIIVDANYVVQNLIYRVRHPDRGATAIEELVKATVIDLYAPRWLDKEMASVIRQVALTSRLPETELCARWNEFRALIRWDDSLDQPPCAPLCGDPKDMPYVMLERKLGADGILSKDTHIRQLGGHVLTLDFVLSARSYARAAVTSVSIRVLGTLLPAAATMAAVDLARRTARGFAALPSGIKALLIVCGAIALLHPTSRKWIADRCIKTSIALAPVWSELMDLVTTLAVTSGEAQSHATLHLREAAKMVRSGSVVPPGARRQRTRAKRDADTPALRNVSPALAARLT